MIWTNELALELLDLYQRKPIIWNPQHEFHSDRYKVKTAWRRIQRKFSADFSIAVLKKKRDNLVSHYKTLSKKIENIARSGEEYEPEWFAYRKMASFLDSVFKPMGNRTTEKLENESGSTERSDPNKEVEIADLIDSSSSSESEDGYESATMDEGEPPISKQEGTKTEKLMNKAYLILKKVADMPKAAKDECQLYCDLLCLKLRALDEHTRQRVMYDIDNLMFNYKQQESNNFNMSTNHYQQPGYFQCFPPHSRSMDRYQLPNYGFQENSFSHPSHIHTPADTSPSNSPQPNLKDDQREEDGDDLID